VIQANRQALQTELPGKILRNPEPGETFFDEDFPNPGQLKQIIRDIQRADQRERQIVNDMRELPEAKREVRFAPVRSEFN